jgi:MFS family permease
MGITTMLVIVIAAQFLRRSPSELGTVPYGHTDTGTPISGAHADGLFFKETLRTHQLWLISLVYFLTYFVYNVLMVHMVIFAEGEGISSSWAVTIMVFLGITGLAGRVIMGFVADRVGNRKVMILSSGLMMLSLVWLMVGRELWMLLLFALVFGFGHGGIATMESPITAKVFGLRAHGVILGLVFFCDTVGGAIGPFLAGYIHDMTSSYRLAFQVCAVLGLMNVIAICLIRPLPKRSLE